MKYVITLTTDYGERWQTTIHRDPDQPIGELFATVTDADGTSWVGQLLPAQPPPPPSGKIVRATVADELPWAS